MKSIVEEASSIVKAIEQAWNNAGQPEEFSIKIYEQPERSFLGMTKKPAKVGLFFTSIAPQHYEPRTASSRRQQPSERTSSAPSSGTRHTPSRRSESTRTDRTQESWTTEMVDFSREWLTNTLTHLGKGNIQFTADVDERTLRMVLNESVTDDTRQERLVFSSFAHLLTETLRTQFKRHLRTLRIHVSTQ